MPRKPREKRLLGGGYRGGGGHCLSHAPHYYGENKSKIYPNDRNQEIGDDEVDVVPNGKGMITAVKYAANSR